MADRDQPFISCEQARQADARATSSFEIPSLLLMENAASNATAIACDMLTTFDLPAMQQAAVTNPACVIILAGSGNNAGDGYAMARHLQRVGHEVMIYALRDPDLLKGDAAINARIAQKLGVKIQLLHDDAAIQKAGALWDDCDLLVDALLGTGFTGDVRPVWASVIDRCNEAHAQGTSVLALDVPSGLNADTGQASSSTIRADVTATFLAMKQGFQTHGVSQYTGKVQVCHLGVSALKLLA